MTALAQAADERLPRIEQVTVGHGVCLFRPDNRATALLNPAAAEICARLLYRECSASDVAPDGDTEGLARQLEDAGFRDAPAERSWRRPAPVDCIVPSDELLLYVSGERPPVGLSCDNERLGVLLRAALAPLLSSRRTGAPATSVSVLSKADLFSVWRDGVSVAAGLDLAQARRVALQSMLLALQPEGAVAAILHASTVAKGDRAILLAGASGSGKSTLSMALLATGCDYAADDFTPFMATQRVVGRFPVAASIKSGSFDGVAKHFPALAKATTHTVGERKVRYLDLSQCSVSAETLTPALIVVPRYIAGSETTRELLSPEDTLAEFLTTGTEVVGHPRSMRPLAALVNETPAWRLTYSDTDAACRLILDTVGRA